MLLHVVALSDVSWTEDRVPHVGPMWSSKPKFEPVQCAHALEVFEPGLQPAFCGILSISFSSFPITSQYISWIPIISRAFPTPSKSQEDGGLGLGWLRDA